MRILSIGNSFSQDAHAYLHAIAESQGVEMECVNLYIGGCSLHRHWINVVGGELNYARELNGDTENARPSAIRDALEDGPWDVVTLQQVSHHSGFYATYQPYLTDLSAYVKKLAPQAKQWLHQTWAYEHGSDHPAFDRYSHSQMEMYRMLTEANRQAAQSIGVDMIPTGEVIQTLRNRQIVPESLCRDTFHLSLTYGRYAAACTWFVRLTGKKIDDNGFLPAGCDPILAKKIRETVHEVCERYSK